MSHNMNIEPVILGKMPGNLDGVRILDVGIGHGQWAFIIRTQMPGNPWIVGVEPFKKYVDWANRVGLYDDIYTGRAQEYLRDHPDAMFDYILCCEVVEHHKTKAEAFKLVEDLRKRVNPGGILFVSTPDGHSIGGPGFDDNDLNGHPIGFSELDFKLKGYSTELVLQEAPIRMGRLLTFMAKIRNLVTKGQLIVTHTIVVTIRSGPRG